MIVSFHMVYIAVASFMSACYTIFVRKHDSNSRPILDNSITHDTTKLDVDKQSRESISPVAIENSRTVNLPESEFESDVGLRFFPPVYVQRYMAIQDILMDERWKGAVKKVVDFGCAEFGFFSYVKHIPTVQEILMVDIDEELLNRFSCRVAPLTTDYLSNRENPLTVKVFAGSIANPDHCLVGTEVVICIEIIEHLWPDEVEAVPYAVFGVIQPRLAIFTTPNSDFNVLFPNFTGFRHWDHKFEWTREQFECWATNITVRYPDYEVSFHGIGPGPPGTEKYGHCSQMALFVKRSPLGSEPVHGIKVGDGIFKLVAEYVYPFRVDSRTETEKICHEAEYQIRLFSSNNDFCNDDDVIEIPICLLLPSVEKWCSSLETLQNILEGNGWEISVKNPDIPTVIYPYYNENCDRFSSDEENEDEQLDLTSLPNQTLDIGVKCIESDENWDWDASIEPSTSRQNDSGFGEINAHKNTIQVEHVPHGKHDQYGDECGADSSEKTVLSSSKLKLKSKLIIESGEKSGVIPDQVDGSNLNGEFKAEELSRLKTKAPFETRSNTVNIYQTSANKSGMILNQDVPQTNGRRHERKRVASDSCFSGLDKVQLSSDSTCQFPLPSYELLPNSSSISHNSSAGPSFETVLPNISSSDFTSNVSLLVNVSNSTAKTYDIDEDSSSDEACCCNSHSEQEMDLDVSTEHSHSDDYVSDQSQDSNVVDNHEALPRIQAHRNHFPFNVIDAPVENGDVANNNRDGEGNNAVALIPEDAEVDIPGIDVDGGDREDEFAVFDIDVGDHEDDVDFIELDFDDEPLLPGFANPFPNWLLNLLQLFDDAESGLELRGAGEPNWSLRDD